MAGLSTTSGLPTTSSIVLDNSPSSTFKPEGPGASALPILSILTDSAGKATATITGVATNIPKGPAIVNPSTSTTVISQTASSSPAPTESQTSSGPDLKVLLPAIVAPVVFVLILASVILFTCLHFRNKKRERLDSGEHGVPAETQSLHKKPSNSYLLPSPLADSDRTRDGSLGIYEKRKSMGEEAAKRNTDIIGMYERPSANGRGAYNYDGEKYTTPRMPLPMATVGRGPPPQNRSPQGRTPPHSRPPPQNRAPPGSRASPRERSPMPPPPPQPQTQLKPKPSPPAPATTTQTVESSWPLPAGGPLPSPNSMHSGKTGHSRKSSKSGNFHLPPVPASEPFSMREALRPESDTYDLSTSAATTVPKVPRYPDHGAPETGHPYDRTSRKRESDAISELSDRDRTGGGGDADRLSVVSAISR